MDLGDQRLNRRSEKVLHALAANSQASINAACSGWGERLAAYRFFDNPAVTPEKILAPHQARSTTKWRASPVRFQKTIELGDTPKRTARSATLEIRALRVTVKSPHARRLPPVTYNVVLVEEINGPRDGTDVC